MSESEAATAPTLRGDALGFRQALTLSIASPAPAYALAVTLGILVATAGSKTPAVLILAFALMLTCAVAGYFLNRVDPDCGTVFHWSRRAFGPAGGFLGGLLLVVAGILVGGILAQTAVYYFFLLVDWTSAAASTTALNIATVIVMAAVTSIAYLGIQLSVKMELFLLWTQILALLLLAVVAIVKLVAGDVPEGSESFSLSWFSPFGMGSETLVQGVLLGVFMFAGWDTGLTVAEETRNPRRTCGRAGIVALLALLVTYLIVCSVLIAFAGPAFLGEFGDAGALEAVSTLVLGSTAGKLVILAVMLSSLATAESAIVAQARTLLSMSRQQALPSALSRIHPRFRTPSNGTLFAGIASTVWLIVFMYASETFLFDSITATGLVLAGYYGMIALAALVYYRRKMFASPALFLFAGVVPALAALGFFAAVAKSAADLARSQPDVTTYWLGVQPPLVIAAAIVLLGLGWAALSTVRRTEYFSGRAEWPDAARMQHEDPLPESAASPAPAIQTVGSERWT